MPRKTKFESDFIERFGQKKYDAIIENAGHHSVSGGGGNIPKGTPADFLLFGLLEILDWTCYKYAPDYKCAQGLTEAQIKKFILEHKKTVRKMPANPPTYLGLLTGAFNFITED